MWVELSKTVVICCEGREFGGPGGPPLAVKEPPTYKGKVGIGKSGKYNAYQKRWCLSHSFGASSPTLGTQAQKRYGLM